MRTRAVLLGSVLSAAVVGVATAGEPSLVTRVQWTDTSGAAHESLFQGEMEKRQIRGHLFEGHDRLVVAGTIDKGGDVSGEIRSPSGELVGRFVATFDGTTLVGGFLDGDDREGRFSAPATCLAADAADALAPTGRAKSARPSECIRNGRKVP